MGGAHLAIAQKKGGQCQKEQTQCSQALDVALGKEKTGMAPATVALLSTLLQEDAVAAGAGQVTGPG